MAFIGFIRVAFHYLQITRTLHPPGGATALIANIGSPAIHDFGFRYVINPVLSGVLTMLVVAFIVNNIPRGRHYPYKYHYRYFRHGLMRSKARLLKARF